jgi:hypothetical protein
MELTTLIKAILIVVVLIYLLYYLWAWMNTKDSVEDMIVYKGVKDGGIKADENTWNASNTGVKVAKIYGGGEYSVSTWIYVRGWTSSRNKPFLELTNGTSKSTLFLYLGRYTPKLGVRVNTQASQAVELSKINDGITGYTDNDADISMGACDIESVDLQRWVHITIVMSGKTVDVYIDGKLSRSVILQSTFYADENTSSGIKLGHKGGTTNDTTTLGFNGFIGSTRTANIAYTPDKVYNIYKNGPYPGFSLDSFDITQYTLQVLNGGSVIFTTS